MKCTESGIRISATDLSNHLSCRHVTTLDLQVARGERSAPSWAAPDLAVIRERGQRHEEAYLDHLVLQKKMKIVNLVEIKDEKELIQLTRKLMEEGAEVIAQGALQREDWFGRPDVLLRVPKHSAKWHWSYEAADTKLARQTKAATILQLGLYSELLETVQGTEPEWMWVIPPGESFEGEAYRVAEYAAYFRYVKRQLVSAIQNGSMTHTYPEPVAHCEVCRWFRECDTKRRADDHLSLVAGIRRQQRNQLEEWDTDTMAKLAVLPIPLNQKPPHGSREAIERVREQARVQVQGRREDRLVHEALLPIEDGMGLCRLPKPCPDDLFLDLEGDPFVGESGLQYLFGFAFVESGQLRYEKRWALNREEERKAFEWLVDEIMRRRKANPRMHVYHFGAYEPAALKRLMGMYATREDEIDRMLRAGVMVDLHQTFKQSTRASVEEYSLKKIEAFYGFERETPLDRSRAAMRYVEHRLELGWGNEEFPEDTRETMEGYNSEDCFSAAKLHDWLEEQRRALIELGTEVQRFVDRDEEASEELDERQKRVAALVEKLTVSIPGNPQERDEDQQATWLLAQLLDWHRREKKAAYWEGYRLADLDDDDLLEERAGLAGLKFIERLEAQKVPVDRYQFPKQEIEVRCEKELYHKGEKFGTVVAVNMLLRTVDVKKTKKTAELHPPAVYVWERPYDVKQQAESLFRIGEWVAENGIDKRGRYRAGRDLLLRKPPRLEEKEKLEQQASETPEETSVRIVKVLGDSVFAIQGPPGSGKTHIGARMICELVRLGKKIGVTALSHKVIRNLLDKVVEAAKEKETKNVHCLHRDKDGEESEGVEVAKKSNEQALDALVSGKANVVGGTSWLWSPAGSYGAVDVLFIDEAGQMSLADVLAVSQAAKKLVLLGDPQQLEQPLQGTHPEGAEKSALEHLLNGRKTISEAMGFLLPQTWRLHPDICKFTSSVFYENKLHSHPITASRVLDGHPWLSGAGLWFVPVQHEGNRSSSPEEVEVVSRIVCGLLKPGVQWFSNKGPIRKLKEEDVLIVAPYNAQVADLAASLPKMRIGTVDKFQGQEAPIVIYSLTTSSPEEAPRGMEFLYSLNRLNVATSRAMSTVILVASPLLFEPECRTPRHMQLASAFCRFAEMAHLPTSPSQ
jgi:uncharacterized protein